MILFRGRTRDKRTYPAVAGVHLLWRAIGDLRTFRGLTTSGSYSFSIVARCHNVHDSLHLSGQVCYLAAGWEMMLICPARVAGSGLLSRCIESSILRRKDSLIDYKPVHGRQ